jgi:polyvinyl alcohol dehydrogenase (cytochrome)
VKTRRIVLLVVLALSATSLIGSPLPAGAAAKCAATKHAGGEWRSFGQNLWNSRFQADEKAITPDTAATMLPKWTFSISNAGGAGNLQSTPVVADGCVYIGTNAGWVFALNADTGQLVWKQSVNSSALLAGLSGGIFSLDVSGGRVFANVSTNDQPYMAALDQQTGKILWKTVVSHAKGSYTNSSPAVINGLVFIGISGPENVDQKVRFPGGFALLDEATGKIVLRRYTTSKRDDARGLKAGSMWGTPVYDADTGYMYEGTGQPANKNRESSLSNAIVKIDMDRSRPTFGTIVDTYKGDYDEGADLDFGGSPIMWSNKHGQPIVGDLQKSGRFHAVYADTMEQAWWARLSDPLALGDAGTGAVDKTSVYVAGNTQTAVHAGGIGGPQPNPGYLYSLNRNNGTENWKFPIASGVDYHLISVAGGIVYVVTTHGALLGIDASNGLPVVARSLTADAHDGCVNLSSGAIVARNMVLATCDVGAAGGGWIVAYGV